MSRRPADTFTRFTSTPPHASSRPPSSSPSPSPTFTTPTDAETPAQKVARLRAAHRAARASTSLSPIDRIIDRGRHIADSAHRIFAYGLIGLTGVATCVSIYGLTSLILHNRRQKRAWIEREMQRLQDAQTAFLQGNPTAEQLHLLEQERAGEELKMQAVEAKRRKKEEGMWSRVKNLVGSGMSAGEMGREATTVHASAQQVREGARGKLLEDAWIQGEITPVAIDERKIQDGITSPRPGVGLDSKGRPVPMERAVQERTIAERAALALENERRKGEKELESRTRITGGPLDVLGQNVGQIATSTTGGSGNSDWWSWVRGSKS